MPKGGRGGGGPERLHHGGRGGGAAYRPRIKNVSSWHIVAGPRGASVLLMRTYNYFLCR